MSARVVYIFVNGINTLPGDGKNWNGRAVTYVHTSPSYRTSFRELGRPPGRYVAEKIEYFCGPIGRAFGQKKRAEKLFRTLSYYRDFKIVLVGHSNGADVILTMMREYNGWPQIEHLHLVCGATEADCDKNLLNAWLRTGRVKRTSVYIAQRDMALRLASKWIGRLLGYGVLGLHGPKKIAPQNIDKVNVIRWPKWGHSECWADLNFDQTMDCFIA